MAHQRRPIGSTASAMTRRGIVASWWLLSLVCAPAYAHHGVAGVGLASLEGPGAPIESATSQNLPQSKVFFYFKLDHADFETFTPLADGEGDYSSFLAFGLGYGIRSWLSAYVFLPVNVKNDEPGGFDTAGAADLSLVGQLGFKWDEGLSLIPPNESADDLEDWHFSFVGGMTIPTGNPNVRDDDGNIDPGKSTGFGEFSFNVGLTATKPFAERWTLNVETSYLHFLEHEYADGNRFQFGSEKRVNVAMNYRALTLPDWKMRLDAVLEFQYLGLGRDRADGIGEQATGGHIFYAVPGFRYYWNKTSVALGVKVPFATSLNEEDQQQGAEGKENFRLLFTASYLW